MSSYIASGRLPSSPRVVSRCSRYIWQCTDLLRRHGCHLARFAPGTGITLATAPPRYFWAACVAKIRLPRSLSDLRGAAFGVNELV